MWVRNNFQPLGGQSLAGETRLRLAPGIYCSVLSAVQKARWGEWFILPWEVGVGHTRHDIGSGLENQSLLEGGGGSWYPD